MHPDEPTTLPRVFWIWLITFLAVTVILIMRGAFGRVLLWMILWGLVLIWLRHRYWPNPYRDDPPED